jgi:ribonucleoside-diphosphate reductase alpha chain
MGAFPSPHGMDEPKRFRLPDDRGGPTVKFRLTEDGIDNEGVMGSYEVEGYFTVNTYPDGMPAEIWVSINKPGYPIQGFANCWAIAMSMLLQYGVHPKKLYDKFKARDFQPNGITSVESVPIAKSIPDLIVRWMELNLAPTARPVLPEDASWLKNIEEVVR